MANNIPEMILRCGHAGDGLLGDSDEYEYESTREEESSVLINCPKGGSLYSKELTDQLADNICSHEGPTCEILWATCKLIPDVPLKRRLWIMEDKCFKHDGPEKWKEATQQYLCPDQRFEPECSGLGVRVSILSVDALNLVHGYWTGKVSVNVAARAVDFAQTLKDRGLSAETYSTLISIADAGDDQRSVIRSHKELRAVAEKQIEKDVDRYGRGESPFRYEFNTLKGMSDAERCMRFAWIGVLNWYRGHQGDICKEYPIFGGDGTFKFDEENGMLTATWVIESHWYNQFSLLTFPFDSHAMCAIFWVKVWKTVRINGIWFSTLGCNLREVEVMGFTGDPKPLSGWCPYICESNVVPNSARDAEIIFYGRYWVRRRCGFFVHSIMIPLFITAMLGHLAIRIAEGNAMNDVVARGESPLSFLSALLLTMVAMKFSYTDNLPKLGYNTYLDWYVLVNMCFLFFGAIIVVNVDTEHLQNLHLSLIYTLCLVVFNAVFAYVAWTTWRIPVEHSPEMTFSTDNPQHGVAPITPM